MFNIAINREPLKDDNYKVGDKVYCSLFLLKGIVVKVDHRPTIKYPIGVKFEVTNDLIWYTKNGVPEGKSSGHLTKLSE